MKICAYIVKVLWLNAILITVAYINILRPFILKLFHDFKDFFSKTIFHENNAAEFCSLLQSIKLNAKFEIYIVILFSVCLQLIFRSY